jgi:hypothetical protein
MRTCGRLDGRDYFQTCRKETLFRILCLHHYLPTSPPREEPVMLKIECERTRSSFWAQASLGCPLMPSLGARSRSFALSRLPHRLFSFSETLKKTKLIFTVRTHFDSGIVTLAAGAGLSCSVDGSMTENCQGPSRTPFSHKLLTGFVVFHFRKIITKRFGLNICP